MMPPKLIHILQLTYILVFKVLVCKGEDFSDVQIRCTCPSGYFHPGINFPEGFQPKTSSNPATTERTTTQDPLVGLCPEGLDGYLPYPRNCTLFIQCHADGPPEVWSCPEGTVWDPEIETCNHDVWSCYVPCPTCIWPSSTTVFTTTTTVPSTPTTPPIPICPEGYEGFHPHPRNCSLFYNCNPPFFPELLSCPDPLLFSPTTLQCDWPFNVPDCEGCPEGQKCRPSPTSTTTSRRTTTMP